MNDLEKFFNVNSGRLIHKWEHYFEIYDRHFARFRNTAVNVVEFGVGQGGSLQMWKDYFGPDCQIFGIDINPECRILEEPQIKIFIGDQSDRAFLHSLSGLIPKIDILIDDGGHSMQQQIATFELLFNSIDKSGVYLCEDMHTSYWPEWGGGYRKKSSFIEYSKNFIDYINAWHSRTKKLRPTDFTESVHSLHFYDSVLVIEKRPVRKPVHRQTGTISDITDFFTQKNFLNKKTSLTKLKERLKKAFKF